MPDDNASLTIELTGEPGIANEVPFQSAASDVLKGDKVTVGLSAFSAGYKAFVVAGGELRVRGWDGVAVEGTPTKTWTKLLEMAEAPMPAPILVTVAGEELVPLVPPMRTSDNNNTMRCPRKLMHHTFDTSDSSTRPTRRVIEMEEPGGGQVELRSDRYGCQPPLQERGEFNGRFVVCLPHCTIVMSNIRRTNEESKKEENDEEVSAINSSAPLPTVREGSPANTTITGDGTTGTAGTVGTVEDDAAADATDPPSEEQVALMPTEQQQTFRSIRPSRARGGRRRFRRRRRWPPPLPARASRKSRPLTRH